MVHIINYINSLLPLILHFHSVGYWIAFFVVLIETTIGVGIIFPGSSIIIFMGALSAQGYLDIGDLLVFAILGAVIGDNINYYLGSKYGLGWIQKKTWFFNSEYFEKGKRFFKKNGAKSIFIGRFVPGIKETVPFVAGIMSMPKLEFFLWNFLGAIGWGVEFVGIGYLFSQSLDLAKIWLSRASFFLVILIVGSVIFYFLKLFVIKKGKEFFILAGSFWKFVVHFIKDNTKVKKVTRKYKPFFQFLERRFNQNNFLGLPLTSILALFALFLLLFSNFTKNIIQSSLVPLVDTRIENLLFHFHNIIFTNFFLWITFLGEWQVVLVFIFVTIILLVIWRKSLFIIPLLLSVLGSESVTYFGKIFFQRSRPLVAMYKESGFSFPSGHATIAVAFYGYLIFILFKSFPEWKTKINIFFTGFLIILLIGFSRLYLGVHYLSDVLVGYLIGLVWLVFAIFIFNWIKSKNKLNLPNKNFRLYFTSVFVIVLAVSFYIGFALHYNPYFIQKKHQQKKVIGNMEDIFSNERLKYTGTILGEVQEPISFIISAKNNKELISLFKKSGWKLTDKIGFYSGVKMMKNIFSKKKYETSPIALSFWNDEVNDFAFENSVSLGKFSKYHYARFWKTKYIDKKGYHIYVGVVSFENKEKWGFAHLASLNLDFERKFLFRHLEKSGMIDTFRKKALVHIIIGKTFLDDTFFTDGKAYFLKLK